MPLPHPRPTLSQKIYGYAAACLRHFRALPRCARRMRRLSVFENAYYYAERVEVVLLLKRHTHHADDARNDTAWYGKGNKKAPSTPAAAAAGKEDAVGPCCLLALRSSNTTAGIG